MMTSSTSWLMCSSIESGSSIHGLSRFTTSASSSRLPGLSTENGCRERRFKDCPDCYWRCELLSLFFPSLRTGFLDRLSTACAWTDTALTPYIGRMTTLISTYMKKPRTWRQGEVTVGETPYVNFTSVKKPWLRTTYDKHPQWLRGGAKFVLRWTAIKHISDLL